MRGVAFGNSCSWRKPTTSRGEDLARALFLTREPMFCNLAVRSSEMLQTRPHFRQTCSTDFDCSAHKLL